MQKEDINRLDKYLNDTASKDEQGLVEQLLGAGIGDDKVREYVKNDWNNYTPSQEIEESQLDRILDGVHHEIHLKDKSQKRPVLRRMYRWYSAVAAILLLPLLLTGVFSMWERGGIEGLFGENPAQARIVSPMGTRLFFQLPDGTNGVLNGGASLEYAIPFSSNRKVSLMGEAYFHVKRDEQHSFVVHTGLVDVKVWGTRFNVNVPSESDYAEVVLEDGSVECFVGKQNKGLMLKPNQRVVVSNGKVVRSKVNAKDYIAWKDGKLVLRGASMDQVAAKISRWYNVDVVVKGKALSGYCFRGTFEDDSLEEVLRLLKMTSPIDYRVERRKLLRDGSYERKRVILMHRDNK